MARHTQRKTIDKRQRHLGDLSDSDCSCDEYEER